jgi:hypothetical protein
MPVSIFQNNYKKNILCPQCRSIATKRIPKEKIIKVVFFWMPVKRYMCSKCRNKFYVREE